MVIVDSTDEQQYDTEGIYTTRDTQGGHYHREGICTRRAHKMMGLCMLRDCIITKESVLFVYTHDAVPFDKKVFVYSLHTCCSHF